MKGFITSENKYQVGLSIPSYLVDASKRLTPSAFMDLAQEMAYLAADAMEFGYDELAASGKAWVLSRMAVQLLRAPLWREEVIISTWHKGVGGPFYLRDFSIDTLDGEPLVKATSSWIVFDVNNRSLVRGSEVLALVPEGTICADNAISTPAPKVMMPRGVPAKDEASILIGYNDVDFLGHTNNTRYAGHAIDCIDSGKLLTGTLKEFYICFNHETHLGDVLRMKSCDCGEDFYVEGVCEDHPAFCFKAVFK